MTTTDPTPTEVERTKRVAMAASFASDQALDTLTHANLLQDRLDHLTRDMEESGEADLVARVVQYVQEARKVLGQVEADLSRALGMRARSSKEWAGEMPGARWEVHGGKKRTRWDHDSWKADARAAVVRQYADQLQVLDTETGEMMPAGPTLHAVITEVQEVHGATSPRTTSLKKLGLDPDDYCETSTGPFTITIIPDVDAGQDTTSEDTSHA